MKLYSSPLSANSLRSRAVAYELGLEPEIVAVDLSRRENRTPEYLALNPNGKVPTLVHGDVVIWESRAINAYLAAQRPESDLYPADPVRRAMVDQWSNWQAIHLGAAMQRVAFERMQKKLLGMGEPDEAAIAGEVKTIADLLPILDAALAGREWIAGALSIADFALGSTFMLRKPARLGVEPHANVVAWIERLEARPSWAKATTPYLDVLRARGAEIG
jgi:glutathione S-transferase